MNQAITSRRLWGSSATRYRHGKQGAYLLLLTIPFVLVGGALIYVSIANHPEALTLPMQWFDPTFFQYNIVLFLVLVLMVPAITYVFVETMREERLMRLRVELPATDWAAQEEHIHNGINIQFGLKNYVGSTATLMIVIALGFSVMLLLKPLPDGIHGLGVNYGKGANILLMGPYIEKFPDEPGYYHRLIVSLTAFQFGFLGAYVFFVGHLLRSYFTLDLTPSTFISISVRMVVSSLVALVVSFLPLFELSTSMIPVVSFFIGFFPSRGILVIEKMASRMLRVKSDSYPSRPLSALFGMSPEHEIRLRREGYDNIENLAQADPIGLAVRTGCGYRQISEWIGQGWLWNHMGNDYEAFKSATGISSTEDFVRFLKSWRATHGTEDPYSFLESAGRANYATKVRIIGELLLPSSDPSRHPASEGPSG